MLFPYEVLIRYSEGIYQGASIKHWDDERKQEAAPEDLGNTSDPRFITVVGEALAAANTQITELQSQLTQAQADAAEVPALRDRISQLEQELDAYRNPPKSSRDYEGLYNSLIGEEGISLFLYIRYVAGSNDDARLAYIDTMSALTLGAAKLPKTDAQLQSCINVLFASMLGAGFGFSDAQTALMRSLLDRNGFESIQFPIGG